MTDRSSLRSILQAELYGEMPPISSLDLVKEIECPHEGNFRLFQRSLDHPFGREIDVLTAFPSGSVKGHIFGINFDGNHSISSIGSIPLPRSNENSELANTAERNRLPEAFPLERIVDAGFAVSTFHVADVLPDRRESTELLREINATIGAVGLWAWGLASVAYTIEKDLPICFVGHSRLGKAALCAAAIYDVASALVPIQSGTGGSAPFGTLVGETVEQLTERFPFWFHPSFKTAHGLTFDSDSIFAACQPARILILGADEDTWADPEGAARMLDRAQDREWVGLDSRSVIRRGTHRVTLEDWDEIIRFLSN